MLTEMDFEKKNPQADRKRMCLQKKKKNGDRRKGIWSNFLQITSNNASISLTIFMFPAFLGPVC